MKANTIKTFTLGFLVGAAVFASTTSYASTTYEKIKDAFINTTIKVTVNGNSVALVNKPIIYKNTNYLPVAEIAKALSAKTTWDSKNQTINITSSKSEPTQSASSVVIEKTFEGMNAIAVNGQTYFKGGDFDNLIRKNPNTKVTATWNKDITIMTITDGTTTFNISKSEMYIYKGTTYCNTKYFIQP